MPPRPSTCQSRPTEFSTIPRTMRYSVGLRKRQHARRRIPLLDRPDLPHVTSLPEFNIDLDFDEDTHEGGVTTDDEGPALAPAAPLRSTRPAAAPIPSIAPSAKVVSPLAVAQSAASLSSHTVAAVPVSIPVGTTTVKRPFFFTSTPEPRPTTFTIDTDDDDGDAWTTGTNTKSLPKVSTLSTSTVAAIASGSSLPTLSPSNTAPPHSTGPAPESKTAIAAAVSLICIALSFGIAYCLFRFCPPVRNKCLAFKSRRHHERQKRMGIDDSPLPPPVVVLNGIAMQQHSTWATDGTAMRNIGIENGVVRELDEAHLRPPTYRSHLTASGASWVANGFRVVPERMSHHVLRWTERGSKNRFMGRESKIGSLEGGRDLVADGLRPLGMNPYGMGEVSQPSKSTTPPRASGVSGISRVSERSSQSSEGGSDTRGSGHSQAGFSTNARISDMSSLSAGTMTNAFRPPPLFKAPIGVARGSVTGLLP